MNVIYTLSIRIILPPPGHPQRYRRDGSQQRGVPHQEQPGQHHHRAVRTHDRGPRREGRAHFGEKLSCFYKVYCLIISLSSPGQVDSPRPGPDQRPDLPEAEVRQPRGAGGARGQLHHSRAAAERRH